MRWPWQTRAAGGDRLAIRNLGSQLAWAQVDAQGRLQRAGLEDSSLDQPAELVRHVRDLGWPTSGVTALLALSEAQLLQIETPAVKPEELKSAARWRIKDLVDARLDELTLDVLHVGEPQARSVHKQLFVVAARNALIQSLSRQAQAAGLTLAVIDIVELAQRNLQHAAALAEGLAGRATALLMRHGDKAVLTLCAGGELYYARHLEWDASGLDVSHAAAPALPDTMEGLDFVDYGAADATPGASDAPRLVVEVQRSLDVWERTWPDLPVVRLWVDAGEADPQLGAQLAAQLAAALGFAVQPLEPGRLFPGFDAMATTAAMREATLPLLGALRRAAA